MDGWIDRNFIDSQEKFANEDEEEGEEEEEEE